MKIVNLYQYQRVTPVSSLAAAVDVNHAPLASHRIHRLTSDYPLLCLINRPETLVSRSLKRNTIFSYTVILGWLRFFDEYHGVSVFSPFSRKSKFIFPTHRDVYAIGVH